VSNYKIVFVDPMPANRFAGMQEMAEPFGLDVSTPATDDQAELDALLAEADGLITQRKPLTAELLAAAPKVKVVQKLGGRRDGLDLDAAKARNVAVALMTTPGAAAVAEHALALILGCAKKLVPSHHLTVTGAYRDLGIEPKQTTERSHGFQWMKIPGLEELNGLTVGIFGFGNIGTEIAKRTNAFDMTVLYHKRSRLPAEIEAELDVAYAEKDELLRTADFVVMISPLTPETEKSIGARELDLMKPTAYLINVCRGGVIDEPALADALRANKIAGAGLDVFVEEPVPFDHPYLSLDNVLLTPHIAGGKGGAGQRQAVAIFENLKRFFDGQPMKRQIA
jgi:phosphoglycerate dehydrogenase-like enzyme